MNTTITNNHIIKNAKRLGIDITAPGIKVLDFGCGLGISVLELRDLGIDAYGVDINQSRIDNAQKKLSEKQTIESSEIFRQLDQEIPFENNTFDYVYANQVLEHVVNLESSISEIARVIKMNGFFYSASPAKFKIVEPHIFVPFAHWLPAGKLRVRYLSLCFKLGIGNGKNNGQNGEQQDRYLNEHTFYRSRKQMNTILLQYFQTVNFVGWQQLRAALNEKNSFSAPSISLLNTFAELLISSFHEHRILMSREIIKNNF